MIDEYLTMAHPTVAGRPITTADVERVWNDLVTIEGGEDEALTAILRSVHFGLRQAGA